MARKERPPRRNDIWFNEFGDRFRICRGGKKVLFLDVKTEGLYEQDIGSFMKEYMNEKDFPS
jgi:hypothetical protein